MADTLRHTHTHAHTSIPTYKRAHKLGYTHTQLHYDTLPRTYYHPRPNALHKHTHTRTHSHVDTRAHADILAD